MTITLAESLEAIAFQRSNNFALTLVQLFQSIIDNPKDELKVNMALGDIQALTFETTGIQMRPNFKSAGIVDTLFSTPYVLDMVIPDLNVANPINPKSLDRIRRLDIENMVSTDLVAGTIDLKNGRVGGFFSKVMLDWNIAPNYFDGYFQADEITAGYLHELGHAYTMFMFMGETSASNLILAEIVGRMDQETVQEKRYQIGLAALKLAEVKQRPVADVTSAEITALVLEGQVKRIQARAGTRWYDTRLTEQVADQFVARWRMAPAAVRWLSKLERSRGIWAGVGYTPRWGGVFMNFINVAMFPWRAISLVGAASLKLGVLIGIKAIGSTFSFSLICGTLGEIISGSGKYYRTEDRVAMIRREMVSMLKDKTLPDDLRKSVLGDIAQIDDPENKPHNFSDLFSVLSDYTLDLFTGRKYQLGENEMKEELANNRLFELSAALKG